MGTGVACNAIDMLGDAADLVMVMEEETKRVVVEVGGTQM